MMKATYRRKGLFGTYNFRRVVSMTIMAGNMEADRHSTGEVTQSLHLETHTIFQKKKLTFLITLKYPDILGLPNLKNMY